MAAITIKKSQFETVCKGRKLKIRRDNKSVVMLSLEDYNKLKNADSGIGTYIKKMSAAEKEELLKGLKYFYAKKEAARLAVKKNSIIMPEIVEIVKKIRVSNARA